MKAKPIIDMVIEINDAESGKMIIPEILEPLGYDCFWRPIGDENLPPFFTWCIKRDSSAVRSHHLHFVEKGFKNRELLFCKILQENPQIAQQYSDLKTELAAKFNSDRITYTQAKGTFINKIMSKYKD